MRFKNFKKSVINEKCKVLEDFGIEVTSEIIDALWACKSEIHLDNYAKKLILDHLK